MRSEFWRVVLPERWCLLLHFQSLLRSLLAYLSVVTLSPRTGCSACLCAKRSMVLVRSGFTCIFGCCIHLS